MTAREHFVRMTRALAVALRERGVRHMVVGGLAVAVHGRPRFTRDIDLVVSLSTGNVVDFLRTLASQGFTLQEENLACRLLSPGQVGRAFFGQEGVEERLHVDMMIVLPGYEQQSLGRAKPHKLLGEEFLVASAEDLLLSKLVSGRPIDVADAESIVARKGERLDHAYLDRWAGELSRELSRPELVPKLEALLAGRKAPPA
ncbi:MAG: hypothetical protein HYZ53_13055 [Planctomycetes bacterium]|nr:hypothetical protein [Planctomycetota bacterium]